MQQATFAGGCFWGIEEAFRKLEGVTSTAAGYMGGTTEDPTYEQVCSGETGHAEVVQLTFDPNRISYRQLLDAFWGMHNPTSLNYQGPDIGTQYRTVIFYHSEAQRQQAEQAKAELDASGRFLSPVVTEIVPAEIFWRAEDYHQCYLSRGLR
ncbi:MAG: peptide-methionine (S)-S-oxide reductase MsrA [Desulfuromonadales bacterium]|nr:peptide-methionine (S)-S-oxide reductase MsrA [Desulfuromonadales bacterium]